MLINNHKFIWFQSPDGHYIACGAIDGIINIFDLTTGKLLHTLEGEKQKIYQRKNCFTGLNDNSCTHEFIWHVIIRIHSFDQWCFFLYRSCHAYQIFNILTRLPTVDYCFWWQPHQDVWCVPFSQGITFTLVVHVDSPVSLAILHQGSGVTSSWRGQGFLLFCLVGVLIKDSGLT